MVLFIYIYFTITENKILEENCQLDAECSIFASECSAINSTTKEEIFTCTCKVNYVMEELQCTPGKYTKHVICVMYTYKFRNGVDSISRCDSDFIISNSKKRFV